MTSLVSCVLIGLFVLPPQLQAQVAGPDIWRTFAENLEPGKTLTIRLKNGPRFKATLLHVSSDAITVQPKTRAAVPRHRQGGRDWRGRRRRRLARAHGARIRGLGRLASRNRGFGYNLLFR
jgi:hypothetical protein